MTPKQTTAACDITFAMLADPAGAVWSYTFLTLKSSHTMHTALSQIAPVVGTCGCLASGCGVQFTTRPSWMLPSIVNLAIVGWKPEFKNHMGA